VKITKKTILTTILMPACFALVFFIFDKIVNAQEVIETKQISPVLTLIKNPVVVPDLKTEVIKDSSTFTSAQIKTVVNEMNNEIKEKDKLLSKYAQLYDTCKNK
jgi:hypothetical protein